MEFPVTAMDAATLLDSSAVTIRRHAKTHDIGRILGGTRVFESADIERLKSLIRSGPGCPKFVDGNGFWKKRKDLSPRKRGKNRQKQQSGK